MLKNKIIIMLMAMFAITAFVSCEEEAINFVDEVETVNNNENDLRLASTHRIYKKQPNGKMGCSGTGGNCAPNDAQVIGSKESSYFEDLNDNTMPSDLEQCFDEALIDGIEDGTYYTTAEENDETDLYVLFHYSSNDDVYMVVPLIFN